MLLLPSDRLKHSCWLHFTCIHHDSKRDFPYAAGVSARQFCCTCNALHLLRCSGCVSGQFCCARSSLPNTANLVRELFFVFLHCSFVAPTMLPASSDADAVVGESCIESVHSSKQRKCFPTVSILCFQVKRNLFVTVLLHLRSLQIFKAVTRVHQASRFCEGFRDRFTVPTS